MNKKLYSTLALVAVFIGLLGFVYFFEKDKVSKQEQEENTQKEEQYVLQLASEDINAITIRSQGEEFVFTKNDAQWSFDGEGKLNQVFIEGLMEDIFEAKTTVYFESENLDEYQLSTPNTEIVFGTTYNTSEILRIGGDGPGNVVYVKKDNANEIFAVSSESIKKHQSITKDTFLLGEESS